MNIAVYTVVTGSIVQVFTGASLEEACMVLEEGQRAIVVGSDVGDSTHYIVDDQPVQRPAQTNANSKWDEALKVWADPRSLVEARARKVAMITKLMETRNRGWFVYGGKRFACDEDGLRGITVINSEVGLTKALPANWLGYWRSVDNTNVPVTTVAQWIALNKAMVAQFQTNFARAQALRAAVASATTLAGIDAISLAFD